MDSETKDALVFLYEMLISQLEAGKLEVESVYIKTMVEKAALMLLDGKLDEAKERLEKLKEGGAQ